MCTLALYFQVWDAYPLIVAANRDERYDRPTAAPALWSGPARMVAGRDLLAGGTWLGVNEHGLLAAILNRKAAGETAVAAAKRSRGLLCLDLLGYRNADEGRAFITGHTGSYDPFTLVIADPAHAWVAANLANGSRIEELPAGLHVFSNTGLHDEWSEKKQRAYALFADLGSRLDMAAAPSRRIREFAGVLADHAPASGSARDAICVHGPDSGTVSSSIVFFEKAARCFHSFYSPGPACRSVFGDALSLAVS